MTINATRALALMRDGREVRVTTSARFDGLGVHPGTARSLAAAGLVTLDVQSSVSRHEPRRTYARLTDAGERAAGRLTGGGSDD